jgi:hypothetical protein
MPTVIQSERPRLRESLLLAGFVLVLAVAVVTVLIPELSKAPETETTPQAASAKD